MIKILAGLNMINQLANAVPKKHKGFTIIELMIAVVVLSILTAIAMPLYSNYVNRAKARNAQADLVSLSVVLENLYQRNLKYIASSPDKDVSVYMSDNNMSSMWTPSTSDTFDYKITANATSYTVKAIGKGKNANCEFSLNNSNQKRVIKNTGCGGLTSW